MTTTADLARQDRLASYGVHESGMPVGQEYHTGVDHSRRMTLKQVEQAGGKISRVRMLQEAGRVDISYIHATLKDGSVVPVRITCNSHLIPRNKIMGEFIEWAKDEGVFAKGLGLLDQSVWSILR